MPDFGSVLNQPGVTTVVTGWGLQNGAAPIRRNCARHEIQMLDRDLCNTTMLDVHAPKMAVEGFAYAAKVFALTEDDAYAVWDEMIAGRRSR